MKEYIKWFLEVVLGKSYKDISTIELWQIEKKNIFNIQCNYTLERQMTIYDIM
ncbi:hypothetical protein [Staphylococcus sp. RIT622]|uniref:hypothetical protein n=1 Tax=Staphylococcus sp. RIT622 TaxID=2510795 RepID=UPI0013EBD745|nr:hypothetical protein [Staphylococcus sp. RIT622]MCG2544207.1 hypothetical protein [Staphylococcus epidermidis]